MAVKFSKEQIQQLPTHDLRAIARSTNPKGALAEQLAWAKVELQRRNNNAVHKQWRAMDALT